MMIFATPILAAVSDTANYAMWAITLIAQGGMGIVLYRVSAMAQRLDRNEDQRREDVAAVEVKRREDIRQISDKLHTTAERLVEERFRAMSHEVKNHVQAFTATLQMSARKLEEAERKINQMAGDGPEHEARLAIEAGKLREFVRECAPSKAELSDLKVAVKELTQAVNKVERENLSRHEMKQLLEEVMRNK